MLIGTFKRKIDQYGRIKLPASAWEELGKRCVITVLHGKSLAVLSDSEWEDVEKFFINATKVSERAVKISHYVISQTSNIIPDNRGRISIPKCLRKHAELQEDVIIIGLKDHFELWNPDHYNKSKPKRTTDSFLKGMIKTYGLN